MSGQDRYDDNDPVTDIDGNVIPGMTKGQSRWIDDTSGLYFHLQKLKRQLRLKLVDDLVRMKAENATDDELIERIQNHHNTRTLMRDLHNVVTENDCAMAPVSRHASYCRPKRRGCMKAPVKPKPSSLRGRPSVLSRRSIGECNENCARYDHQRRAQLLSRIKIAKGSQEGS